MGAGRWLGGVVVAGILGAVGLVAAFPGVLSRVRDATTLSVAAPAGCDLWEGPCAVTFPDGVRVTLEVAPRPVLAMSPVRFTVRVDGQGRPTAIDLEGIDMNMGLVHVPLTADGDAYVGRGSLPACSRPEMPWRADVVLGDRTAVFTVRSRRPTSP